MDCDRKRTSKKSDLGRRNQKENTRKKSKTIHWTNERSVEYIRTSCHTQTHTRYCATCDKRSVSFVLARRNAFFFFLFFVCVLSLYKSSSLVQLKSQTEDEEEKREREREAKNKIKEFFVTDGSDQLIARRPAVLATRQENDLVVSWSSLFFPRSFISRLTFLT